MRHELNATPWRWIVAQALLVVILVIMYATCGIMREPLNLQKLHTGFPILLNLVQNLKNATSHTSTTSRISEYNSDIRAGESLYLRVCSKNTKKKIPIPKTDPDVSNRAKNLLSVQYTSEILRANNRLSNQLLLSSEIGPFEHQSPKILQNFPKSL